MSTYTPIASQTLGSAASSVTFSSIPQGYTDLIVVVAGKNSSSTYSPYIQFNGDTSTNYSITNLYGDGSTAVSNRASSTATAYLGSLGATQGNVIVQIQNYSNATTYKTALIRINDAGFRVYASVMLWRSTAAITSVNIFNESPGTFASGTTFSIYGIAVGNSSAKADGGSSVTTDGSYWYHAFKSSGAFIPKQALTADILVVAGGGGGGTQVGGGGGAGGLLGFASQSLSTTNYTVTVGAGGATGASGANSQFGSLTAAVAGGRGGGTYSGSAATGGSGGGGDRSNSGAAGTGGQGNTGGNGSSDSSGGGGGAAAAGTSAPSDIAGGAGGNGSSAYSAYGLETSTGQNVSGTVYYAGGGGGVGQSPRSAAGGLGGGGAGATDAFGSGSNATANTGGGGGGGGDKSDGYGGAGGLGGSGIVIIRYAV